METIITYPKDRKEELLKVCMDISKKDNSFIWKEQDGKITIESEDKDICHRRGMWLIHNFDSRIKYEVK